MRKKDEMELQVSYKAVRVTWFATVMVLFMIGVIVQYNSGGNNIFLVIASLSVGLNILLERYYLSRVDEETSFVKFSAMVALLVVIMLFVLWWVS